jgi:hypothetical protein
MKTPAIIASLTVAGSIAFAAGQQSATTQPRMARPSEHGSDAPRESEPRTRLQQLGEECPPDPWFHPALREFAPGCAEVVALPLSPADVNGDGADEVFRGNGVILASGIPIMPEGPYPLVATGGIRVTTAGATPFLANVAQIDTPTTEALIAELPDSGSPFPPDFCQGCCYGRRWTISAHPTGWIDADADGDLDLVLIIRFEKTEAQSQGQYGCTYPTTLHSARTVWLENIGFEKPAPPVAADLNQDGQVDGADLGLLLVAWGPNP